MNESTEKEMLELHVRMEWPGHSHISWGLARIAALEAALKPFADYEGILATANKFPDTMQIGYFNGITVGDCRKALEVLRTITPEWK